jgi:hypothetical protein
MIQHSHVNWARWLGRLGNRWIPNRLPLDTNAPTQGCQLAIWRLPSKVIRLRYRASVTLHVPGVHDIEIELAVAVPAQLWGPLTMILPSLVRVPLKPLNGAANESEQPVWVTATLCPTSEGSQCSVMFQVPATLGHVEPLSPPLEDDELELQARRHRSVTRERVGCMISSYMGRRAQGGLLRDSRGVPNRSKAD